MSWKFALTRFALAASVSASALFALPAANAAEPLRICASTKDAPYSETGGKGFENKIAEKLAESLNRKAQFVWYDKDAIYLLRDGLNKQECDLVFGVDAGDERVLTTAPIYRTGYVMVSREDKNFTSSRWEDIRGSQLGKFAIRFYSPAENILKYSGKWEDNASYLYSLINFRDNRNKYNQVAANRLVDEVTQGEADMSIAFAPDVARYVKAAQVPVRMTLIEDPLERSDGKVVPLQYSESIGVRLGDTKLLAAINAALPKIRADIEKILSDEGIPLLPTSS